MREEGSVGWGDQGVGCSVGCAPDRQIDDAEISVKRIRRIPESYCCMILQTIPDASWSDSRWSE